MYSNKKSGFSILDLLVKIIFAALFIFILVWLFQKKIPNINMTPFYSNVFRENIKYMQDAGEAYFTDEKMPTEVGDTIKLSLQEMEEKNLIIPFVDKDGNTCDKKESYVSVTKLDEGYELKTNLVCPKESNYIVKTLGCHTYCKDKECSKKCSIQKLTEYQYKKLVKTTKTVYSCNSGYKLDGKYCIKSVVKDTKDAIKTGGTTTITKPATPVTGDSKLEELKVVTTDKKTQLTTSVNTNKKPLTVVKTVTPAVTRVDKVPYDCSTTETVKVPYACTKTRTVTKQQCSTTYQTRYYSCNCSSKFVGGRLQTSCNTCSESVPVQSCKDVTTSEPYTDTCYREETKTNPKTCYKDKTVIVTPEKTTYSCPSGTDEKEGSGANLKCYKLEKTYSCPSGTTIKEGSGANLKCYKVEKVYSCPSGTDVKEGSGASLKCYRIISGTVTYKCETGYTLKGKTCYKTVPGQDTYKCENSNYKVEGTKCILYGEEKVDAKSTKKTTSSYTYKWSKQTSLSGYTRTGKTRTVDGEEICE